MRRKKSGCVGKFIFSILLLLVLVAAAIYYVKPELLDEMAVEYQIQIGANNNFVENTIKKEEVEGSFFYNQLSEENQTVYKEILQGVRDYKTEIQVHSGDAQAVGATYQKLLYDRPELFWCDGSAVTTSFSNYTIVNPNYSCSLEEKERRQSEIDASVQECLNGAPNDGSTYDQIKYVYEYLVDHTDYVLDSSDSQNIYSVFVNKVSVCAGYAKATQLLLQKLGIPCIYVVGRTVDTQQAHAWNLVQIDDEYYHVDTTWGDPVFVMQEDNVQNASNISYDYLCCNDENASKTHEWDEALNLPVCTSNQYNYYVLNHCYYETYDWDTCLSAMNQSIYAGDSQTVFKFSNEEAFLEAKEPILNDIAEAAMQNLMNVYGLDSVSIGQMVDDSSNKIVLYWNYTT